MKLSPGFALLVCYSLTTAAFAQGIITTWAGTGTPGFSGDLGAATTAQLSTPSSVAVDASGNVYIADSVNFRIRRVTTSGIISTYAGSGTSGFSGDGGSAIGARFRTPRRVAVTAGGVLYISDTQDHRVRRVTAGGIISTVAGNGNQGLSGDGGSALTAMLDSPEGLALDSAGNLYIADLGNLRVRMVTPGGIITTVAGNGNAFSTGDGGQATAAGISGPLSLAVDTGNNLYIGEFGSGKVRKVTPGGVISTYAGTGIPGYAGDGGQAALARFGAVQGIAFDGSGNLYIADPDNKRIRQVAPGGLVSTVAGNGTTGTVGDGSVATFAQFVNPADVATDVSGGFYISDAGAHRVRRVGPIAPTVLETGPVVQSGLTQTFTFKFSHPNGFAQLGVVNALINSALDANRACYIAYSQPQRVLYLVNDPGPADGLSAPLVLGGTGQVSNSQCTIFSNGSSVSTSGNTMTLVLNIAYTSAFPGNKVVYLAAQSVTNASSGWSTMGLSVIPEAFLVFPRSDSASPQIGTSQNVLLSFTYQDSTAASNLQTVWALTNTAVDARGACYISYYQPGNIVLLTPDNGDGAAAFQMPLSGTAEIENSQCRVSTLNSFAVASGNTLTVTLNVTFKNGFTGGKGIWTAASTLTGLVSGWKIVGARLLP